MAKLNTFPPPGFRQPPCAFGYLCPLGIYALWVCRNDTLLNQSYELKSKHKLSGGYKGKNKIKTLAC